MSFYISNKIYIYLKDKRKFDGDQIDVNGKIKKNKKENNGMYFYYNYEYLSHF